MEAKEIAVIGAGPVGGILTAHLCTHGHKVHLVDAWKEHIDRIRTHGLRITGREQMLAHPANLCYSIVGTYRDA